MPAIPIAESSAPIVVGISATSSEISVVSEIGVCANRPNGRSVATTIMKISVSPASRMLSAISFGVLRRSAPSTSAIIRSRNECPGSWVISTTIRSESTRVPPVTALRSPPDSRITGADSPVIADSSTVAMPSITVPSPGISSPASTTTTSPFASSDAGFVVPSSSVATVSWRIARSVSACARPRPSANASAMFANTTVSHSQNEIVNVYQAGSLPPPSGLAAEHLDEPGDGRDHGADLDHEHHRVADLDARVELDQAVDQRARDDVAPEQRDRAALVGARRLGCSGVGIWCSSCRRQPVEGEVQLEHVDARLAGEAEAAAVRVLGDQAASTRRQRAGAGRRRPVRLDVGVGAPRCRDRCPTPSCWRRRPAPSRRSGRGSYGCSSAR